MKIVKRLLQCSSLNHYGPCLISNPLIKAKERKALTYQQLASTLSVNKVWLTSVLHGQNCCDLELAQKICAILDLPPDHALQMTLVPVRGGQNIDNDPLVYRFNELIKVYGSSLRGVIHEEFGDGIMSAIDCKLDVNKSKESRVWIQIDGKFLPYYKGS